MSADAVTEFEIERKYLLDGTPVLPANAIASRLEQGYLAGDDDAEVGRLRRTVAPDGSVRCTHTVKHGHGLKRLETQRDIDESEFEQRWPGTEGRRIRKTRHQVPMNALFWEIDVFDDLDLVLAEIELPDEETVVALPEWLAAHVVREVTGDSSYSNHALATRGLPGGR